LIIGRFRKPSKPPLLDEGPKTLSARIKAGKLVIGGESGAQKHDIARAREIEGQPDGGVEIPA
jgi:hypothetical protein